MNPSPRHLRIGLRLGLCFSIILSLMIAVACLAISSSRDSREALLLLVELSNTRMGDIDAMRQAITQQDRAIQHLGMTSGIEEATDDIRQIDRELDAYHALWVRFEATLATDEERRIADETQAYDRQLDSAFQVARASVAGFNPGMAARTLGREAAPVHAKWLLALDKLSEIQGLRISAEIESQAARAARVDTAIEAVSAIAVLLATLIAWLLTASITAPLRQAIRFAAAVGSGELDAPLPRTFADEPGQLLLALKRMATQLQHADAAMKRLAIEDGLTGVYNRRHLDAVLAAEHERAIRAAQRGPDDAAHLALLLIDVDHFKDYNDRWGHPAGDACLCAIVGAVRDAGLRPGDLVARYGGEEFVVLLPACDLEGAMRVAERVRRQVEALPLRNGRAGRAGAPDHVSVSIGVAGLRDARGSTPADLIRMADEALYDAKNSGRNRVCRAPARPVAIA